MTTMTKPRYSFDPDCLTLAEHFLPSTASDGLKWELAQAIQNATIERDALAREIEGMREALRELLQYLDDHDWGNIPEGVTAERARAALTLSKKESVE